MKSNCEKKYTNFTFNTKQAESTLKKAKLKQIKHIYKQQTIIYKQVECFKLFIFIAYRKI